MTHKAALVLVRKHGESPVGPSDSGVFDLVAPYQDRHDGSGGKWDWFAIGGRWEGILGDSDSVPVHELPEGIERIVDAVITPDGVWHDWAWSDDRDERSRETWETEVRRRLVGEPEARAVLVDFHL